MTAAVIVVLAAGFLAYANGANDNFKGVATLLGSGTTHYAAARAWATLTTFAGSMASLVVAGSLVQRFSGRGLVPDAIAASPSFLLAVILGAGLTVILASVAGYPISTTHGLTGALLGAGVVAIGARVNFAVLGKSFFLPLLSSPLIAVALGLTSYAPVHWLRRRPAVSKRWDAGRSETDIVTALLQPSSIAALQHTPASHATVRARAAGAERYAGRVGGPNAQVALNAAHYFSAGVVSFARGLNDTPKLTALLISAKMPDAPPALLVVAVAIAVGGWLNAYKVAETMSRKITPLNHAQGFTANLVTGALVVAASRLGLPVSTTHISVGSLFGIGLITRQANWRVVSGIILSWVCTLPVAALLSGGLYWLLNR